MCCRITSQFIGRLAQIFQRWSTTYFFFRLLYLRCFLMNNWDRRGKGNSRRSIVKISLAHLLHELGTPAVPSVCSHTLRRGILTAITSLCLTIHKFFLEHTLLEGISTSAKQFKGKLVHMWRAIAWIRCAGSAISMFPHTEEGYLLP